MATNASRQADSPLAAEPFRLKAGLAVTLVAAVATLLMLEATRVFLSYTVFVIDQNRRELIAITAFGVFAAFAVGGLAGALLKPRGAVATTVFVLIGARLILQLTEHPEMRLVCGGVVLIAWGWMVPSLRAIRPGDAARGVVYGLLLDLAVRFLFGTVDLPWMPSGGRHAVTIVLVVALLVALVALLSVRGVAASGSAGAALLGVGPGLAVFHLLTGNMGVFEVKADLPIQMTIFVAAIGLGAGFAMQVRPVEGAASRNPPAGWTVALVLTLLALLALFGFWRWNGVADLLLMAVAGISAQLLVLAVRGRGDDGRTSAPVRDGVWLTVGMLLQATLVFAYYTETGFPLLIGGAVVLLGLGAAFSANRGGSLPTMTGGRHLPAMVLFAVLLLGAGLVVDRGRWDAVEHVEVLDADLTIVSYNIQSGFSAGHEWNLEQQARVIESLQPDIVLLQEVSRGWMITSGVDQARWLSHRLDMNLIWGPSSHDDLWGLAILTRAGVQGAEMRIFDTTENLQRGVLGAALQTEAGTLFVYNTHLDDPTEGDATRFEQVTQLIESADGSPAVLGGDFNAPPDSDVIAAVLAAGFDDPGASLPPELSTRTGALRIDYVFVRGSFTVTGVDVPDESASDHKPVVVRVTLQT